MSATVFVKLQEARRLAGLLGNSGLRAEVDQMAAGGGREDLVLAAIERRICAARKALKATA